MKSFLLKCFSVFAIIITVKEATQNPVLLPFGSTPKVWELLYQHVGAGPFWTFRLGDSVPSVTCVDMMLRAPEGFRSVYEDNRVRRDIKSATTSPLVGTLFTSGDVFVLLRKCSFVDIMLARCEVRR